MVYYFRNKYSEFDSLFPKVKLQHFKNLPISRNLKEKQTEIAKLVDEVTSIKEQGKNSTDLENQIDQIVYKLYDLTEEEIKIIEGIV